MDSFEKVIQETISSLPKDVQKQLENVSIHVFEKGSKGRRARFIGTPLNRRQTRKRMYMHQRIEIYTKPHLQLFGHNEALLKAEIRKSLLYEIGRFLGIPEKRLQDLF